MPQGNKRRPHVLLGITGSVAAVKGPEIAVRLARDDKMHVRVLLTSGGLNFWNKAQEYNPTYWEELQKRILTIKEEDSSSDEEGRIYIHSEFQSAGDLCRALCSSI